MWELEALHDEVGSFQNLILLQLLFQREALRSTKPNTISEETKLKGQIECFSLADLKFFIVSRKEMLYNRNGIEVGFVFDESNPVVM